MITEEWLNSVNENFTLNNVNHRIRPFEALRIYSQSFNVPVAFNSEVARTIFDWFGKNTKQEAHFIGALFESAYYYDGEFWELNIPIFFGTIRFEPFDSLKNMPDSIKNKLINNSEKSIDFIRVWADSFDFGLGCDEIRNTSLITLFGLNFFKAATEELGLENI